MLLCGANITKLPESGVLGNNSMTEFGVAEDYPSAAIPNKVILPVKGCFVLYPTVEYAISS